MSCICKDSNIIIKQIYCQNGIRRVSYSTFSSTSQNETINLNFGFELMISNVTNSGITFVLKDSSFGIGNQQIYIVYNSYKMISLPARNGTYRIYIIV